MRRSQSCLQKARSWSSRSLVISCQRLEMEIQKRTSASNSRTELGFTLLTECKTTSLQHCKNSNCAISLEKQTRPPYPRFDLQTKRRTPKRSRHNLEQCIPNPPIIRHNRLIIPFIIRINRINIIIISYESSQTNRLSTSITTNPQKHLLFLQIKKTTRYGQLQQNYGLQQILGQSFSRTRSRLLQITCWHPKTRLPLGRLR